MRGRIEPFREQHLDACAGLFASVFREEPWYEPWTLETAWRRLRQILDTPRFVGFVHVADDRVLALAMGCCWQDAEGESFHLYEMCVEASARGKGVGGELLRHLEVDLRERGVSHVFLLTMGASFAEEFCLRNGYHENTDIVPMAKRVSNRPGAARP